MLSRPRVTSHMPQYVSGILLSLLLCYPDPEWLDMCLNLCPAFSLVYSSVQSDLTRAPVNPDLCAAFSLTDAKEIVITHDHIAPLLAYCWCLPFVLLPSPALKSKVSAYLPSCAIVPLGRWHYTSPLIPSTSPRSPVVNARLVLHVVLGPPCEASA